MKAENQVADHATIRENKLSLVERLAEDLAHEIKNPLHAMVINLEVLRRRLARLEGNGGEDLLRYTGIVTSELERVNRRIDLLLRLTRPYREPEDSSSLSEVFEELRELVELECERRNLSCRFEPPSSMVMLPRAAARQLILSLALETLDALPPGGTLSVAPEVEADIVRIHFHGHHPTSGLGDHAARDDSGSYLTAARALTECLGGSLETAAAAREKRAGVATDTYVLALPRDA
ncbi:MAG: histidine kinase dimerization/phospho-acceptor domain-containing protein [Gemmatimonadota bacterium]